ncbi:MAG: DUF177 domain-containing protein [Clostridia bacterium]|nr:DUF177 domain-containing protein [Clostridia bacterium]
MEKYVDISPILEGSADKIGFSFEFEVPDSSEWRDVAFPTPVRVTGSVTDTGGYIELSCHTDVDYVTPCARCLREVRGTLHLVWTKGVAVAGTLVNEDTDDYVLAENGRIEVFTPLAEQIVLEFPAKVLCKPDCKGLCSKCGKDLNEGECSCPKKEIDPRLAALAKIRDQLDD